MTAMPPVGFGAPPPVVSAPPAPDVAEALACHVAAKRLGFVHVGVRAPSWREILFGAGRIQFRLPKFPVGASAKLDEQADRDPSEDVDDADKEATKILSSLAKDKPRGTTPRSISARRALPPPGDALATWQRRATLTVLGPTVARLLVSAGGLTAADVDTLDDVFPSGLDLERKGAVEAAIAITGAAARHGKEADLPGWLNDQLLTLMDEERPIEFYKEIFEAPASETEQQDAAAQGPSASGPPSRLAEQNRPPAGEGIQ